MTNSKTCVTTAILEIGNTSVIGACFVTLGHKVSCLAVQMLWTFYKCSTNEVFLKCYLNHFSANKNTLCISLFLNTPPPKPSAIVYHFQNPAVPLPPLLPVQVTLSCLDYCSRLLFYLHFYFSFVLTQWPVTLLNYKSNQNLSNVFHLIQSKYQNLYSGLQRKCWDRVL